MTKPIPVVFCVDIEPDPREVDRASAESWAGFEKLMLSVGRIRETFEAATGRPAHFTWSLRMDPQVAEVWGTPAWAAEAYERELAELTGEGDELGVHPHSWRWRDPAGRWVSDQGDAGWVAHCAHTALDSYREAFGRPCAAYRHGDRAMTTRLARLIDDAGVQVDLTVEPGLPGTFGLIPGELTTGWIESTVTAPTYPYRPSRDDFRIPDPARRDGLLMIPLTRGLGIDVEVDRGRVRPRGRWDTLVLWDSPERFRGWLFQRLGEPSLTHLAFAIRTELPLRAEWSWFEANLAELCRHPMAREFRFCTASEAAHEVVPTAHSPEGQVDADAPASARAGLWAGGAEDPGYIEHAEPEALRVLSEAAARHLEHADELGERARDLAERLGAAERSLADARAAAAEVEIRASAEAASAGDRAERLDAANRELQAVCETTTWRAHDRVLPILRAVRRAIPRRR
jgi:hypothetical protein